MTPRTGFSPSYVMRPAWGQVIIVTPAPRADNCRCLRKVPHAISTPELVVQPVIDFRGNQLRVLAVQEVSDAVDDLEGGAVSRKVRAEVAKQVGADRSVVGAMHIQSRHRRGLHGGCRLGFRARVGE